MDAPESYMVGDDSAKATQRDKKGRLKPVNPGEVQDKSSEEQVKLDNIAIGMMRADFFTGKTVEETAKAFEINERRVRRWFHSFDEQDRITKSRRKSSEEQVKTSEEPVKPAVTQPVNPPPAETKEQKDKVGKIYSDFLAGLTVGVSAHPIPLLEPWLRHASRGEAPRQLLD